VPSEINTQMCPSTSTDTTRKPGRRNLPRPTGLLLLACLACHHLALVVAPAWTLTQASAQEATPLKVAVLPFNGPAPAAQRARAQVIKSLGTTYELVPQQTWDESAQKLFATSRSADDLAAVAKELGVQVIVTGAVKREEGWVLVISIRQGATGQSLEKKRYPLRSPSINPPTARAILTDIPPLVDQVGAAPPPPEVTGPPPPTPDETEAVQSPAPTPVTNANRRPSWAPYFDTSLSFELSGRRFAFEEKGQPEFRSVLAPALRLDVNVYPLAFLSTQSGSANRFLQGLGVGATFDFIFWPDSIACPARDADGNCISPTTERFATRERRIEVGPRWRWNILNREGKPELLLNAQYGQHIFSIAKQANNQDVGPPDVTYQYLTLGAGTRIPVHPIVAVFASFNYHIVFDSGSIHTNAEYGEGGAWGLRVHAGGEVRVWKGIVARLAGFYERFGLSFDNSAPGSDGFPVKITTGDATDQYYGLWAGLGYVF
jgi:TolB-like protein